MRLYLIRHADAVVTSPLLRARQTAQELMPPSGPDAPSAGPAECEFLAPGGRRRKLARYLEELDKESVALVGHRPDIDELAGWLIGYRKAGIGLAKGAAALIDCDGAPGKGSGTLRWLLTPEWVGAAEHPAEEGEMNGGTRKRRPAAGKRR
jgi:phosphohistidine phosphatase SixA